MPIGNGFEELATDTDATWFSTVHNHNVDKITGRPSGWRQRTV